MNINEVSRIAFENGYSQGRRGRAKNYCGFDNGLLAVRFDGLMMIYLTAYDKGYKEGYNERRITNVY